MHCYRLMSINKDLLTYLGPAGIFLDGVSALNSLQYFYAVS